MKFRLAIVPLLVLFAVSFAVSSRASAAPNAKITLTTGQLEVVSRNGCALEVTKNTAAVVIVKCNALPTIRVANAVTARTLNPGQKLKIFASGCELAVLKNKPGSVKVRCQPIPTEIVTVGPNGAYSFSAETVNISAGETVKWIWNGDNHTVTSGEGVADGVFCSPNNKNCATAPASNTGAVYLFSFNSPGVFKYFCRLHSSMTGTVNVSAP